MKTVLYIFTIKKSAIPFAFLQMAIGRGKARRLPGVHFAKLMGTGTGETFTPSDADLRQWALLFVVDSTTSLDTTLFIQSWKKRSEITSQLLLNPVSSHGKWSKKQPFEISQSPRTGGNVVAITRARLRWNQAIRFWKSIPPVVTDLHAAPGLRTSFGIGEAPIGLQGTFSLWESEGHLRDFAYKNEAHRRAIADTEKFNWYSEELFARFDVIDASDFHHVD
jgi:hypothetical protein